MDTEKARLYAYYFVMFVLSLATFCSFHYMTRNQRSDYLYIEKCVLCAISTYFNMFVLYYHYNYPPHPKFVILDRRRFSMYIHIVSGVLEFIMCYGAFFTGNERIATIAALAAILGHVPTAYYQTSIVFGVKALMVSGYLLAISLHLFCALHLLVEPASTYWLLNMFLVYNIYVWCRVFYYFYGYVGVFKDTRYTISIMTSGLIIFPAVLGISANVLFLGYVASSILLYFYIVLPTNEQRIRFVSERSRDLLVGSVVHDAWIKENTRLATMAEEHHRTDQQRAKEVFDQLNENKNESLDNHELTRRFKQWDAVSGFMKQFSYWPKKREISFEVFYKTIWRLGDTSLSHVKEGEKLTDMAKARFIFHHLDSDCSSYIDKIKLQKLLIQWGLPDDEVDAYLVTVDDKRFSFDEFFNNLKPIWIFAYENVAIKEADDMVSPPVHTD